MSSGGKTQPGVTENEAALASSSVRPAIYWGLVRRARNKLDYIQYLQIESDQTTGPEIFSKIQEILDCPVLPGETPGRRAWRPSLHTSVVYKARAINVLYHQQLSFLS